MTKYRTYIRHSCENVIDDFNYLLPTPTDEENPVDSYNVYDTFQEAWDAFEKQRKHYLEFLDIYEQRIKKIRKELNS